ncbi:MAG: efflux RND transporter periplasmic adaptor subunit [Woeseiaceae bacterium]|nr:efflux RND transporter periplasmic adaptor subunit [Woeseiaceae bacterium]
MLRKLLRALLIVGIIAVSLVIAAGLFFTREAPPTRPPASTALLVETVPLERVNADFSVRTQGTVAPRTETIVSAEVSGTITEISPAFVAGGFFKAGDVLMRIDPTNYEVAVDQAEALVRQREIEFEGAQKLRTQGFRAEADYASASAALATAKAERVRAKRNLERTYIRLPYDGLVRSKDADLGQFVNPGTRLGVTFGTNAAEVRLPLTDQDLAFVSLPRPGMTSYESPAVALSAVQQGEQRRWDARIVRSEGTVDASSRVTYLVAQVDDPYGLASDKYPLPVGSFVSAEISGTSRSDVLRVPRAALRGSNQLMIRDSESRLRIRDIQVIRADAEFAYLSGGASEGEEVILTALESPVNGTPVRTPDDPPAPDEPVEVVEADAAR